MEETRSRVVMLVANDVTRDARVRKEALSAARAGYDVTIVALKTESTVARESWTPEPNVTVRVRRVGRPLRGVGNALTRRLRNYGDLNRIRRAFAAAAAEERPDLIHANDLDTLPAAVKVRRASGIPVVYDAHELYEERFVGRGVAEGAIVALQRAVLRHEERRAIRQVDSVVTVSHGLADALAAKHRITRPVVVMNGPAEHTDVTSPVHHPVRLLFQGAFGANRGLLPLVSGMARLRGEAVLTLQGFGGIEDQLRALVESEGLGDVVRFEPPCPPDAVVRCARDYDVGVIPYPLTTRNLALTTPNKLFDYLGAGLAIATTDAPGILGVEGVAQCGVSFDAADTTAMFGALQTLVADPERLDTMKRAAAVLGASLAWDQQASALLATYAQLLPARIASLGNQGLLES